MKESIVIPVSALRRIFVMLLVVIGLLLLILIVRTQLFRAGISTLFAPDVTEVYYLSATEDSAPQLIKRGSEPQGPREPMIIPQANVLFIENLRADSEIVTAITRFKSGQAPAATAPPAQTTRPSTATPSPTR